MSLECQFLLDRRVRYILVFPFPLKEVIGALPRGEEEIGEVKVPVWFWGVT